MKTTISIFLLATLFFCACQQPAPQEGPGEPSCGAEAFVRVQGPDLIQPDGTKLLIRGTNLGNWLNPEGYMFGFRAPIPRG